MSRFAVGTAFLLSAAFCLSMAGLPALASGEIVAGPVRADVERVIDGDTFVVVAHVWPGHSVRVAVRIRGIDAPEMKSRCRAERQAAEAARLALEELVGGEPVLLANIGGGKYYGRVVADVVTRDGRAAADALIAAHHARPYSGGRRGAYC